MMSAPLYSPDCSLATLSGCALSNNVHVYVQEYQCIPPCVCLRVCVLTYESVKGQLHFLLPCLLLNFDAANVVT